MSNQFLKLRRSSVPGKIPTTSSLEFGEIALNTYDGLAFIKKSGSNGEEIITIGATSGSFSGSLFGTASWAEQALTSSYSLNMNGEQYKVAIFDGNNSITSSTIYQSGSFTAIRATAPNDPTNPDVLFIEGTGIDSYNLISAHADINSYAQVNVQNFSAGITSSADIVATNNIGDEESYYINMGINGDGYNIPNGIGSQNDAYLYSIGEDLLIGNATEGKRVIIFNGTGSAINVARVFIVPEGTVGINATDASAANPESLLVEPKAGATNTSQFGNHIIGKGTIHESYLQSNIINLGTGSAASADVVATNDIGTETDYYIDMGINSSGYNTPNAVGMANDAYLYSTGEHLHIGNASANMPVMFFAGGFDSEANRKLELWPDNQHQMTGSLNASEGFTGSLYGTASWALNTLTASFVQNAVSAAYAATASSADNFVVRGSITGSDALFTGTITAQRLNVQYITASTEFVTGSSKFGSQLTDTHQFTGSVSVTGSFALASLTPTRIPYVGTGGALQDSAKLTYDDTTPNSVIKIYPSSSTRVASEQAGITLYDRALSGISGASGSYTSVTQVNSGATPEFRITAAANGADTSPRIVVATPNYLSLQAAAGSGNTLVGTTSDSGDKFQVSGSTLFRGAGNTSANSTFTAKNSDGNSILRLRNDGFTIFGNNANAPVIYPQSTAGSGLDFNGTNLSFYSYTTSESAISGRFFFGGNSGTQTSGQHYFVNLVDSFAPTTGTSENTTLRVRTTINQTGGANGITRGLYLNPTITSAADWRSIEWSNNSGSGWGLYGTGTAFNYLAGALGIGSTALTNQNLRISRTITGSGTPTSIYTNSTIQADAGTATYYLTDANTVNTNFALSNLYHYQARQAGLLNVSAGGSVFNQIGFFVDSTLTGASNNYGFYGQVPSGAGRWNLYMQGGASNYLSGSLGIGNTSLTGFGLRLSKPLTDAVGVYGIVADGQIQSDVVAQAYYYLSQASTQATSFTLTNLAHYVADQGTFGVGSTVSVQYGFRVRPTLIGATSNNYGFYGEIPFGSGRWNLYMQGGATNFLSGSLLIGTNTDAGFKLDVSGSARITNGLQVTGSLNAPSITGSLFGTASWASSTLTASYVLPLTQSVIISGSTSILDELVISKGYSTYTPATSVIAINAGTSALGRIAQLDYNNDASILTVGYYGLSSTKSRAVINGGVSNIGAVLTLYNGSGTGSVNLNSIGTSWVNNGFNFGVGTSAPAFSFDVSGSGRYTNGLQVTGSLNAPSITGSLFGTASWALNALTASSVSSTAIVGDLSRIATGSVTASVGVGTGSFQLVSGSSTLFLISSSGNINVGLSGSSTSITFPNTVNNFTPTLQSAYSGNSIQIGIANAYVNVNGSNVISLYGSTTVTGINGTTAFVSNQSNLAWPTIADFQAVGTSRMRILTNGNVGIGTTTPTASLHISGSTGSLFQVDSNTTNNILYVTSSGNVGIGTNAPFSNGVGGGLELVGTTSTFGVMVNRVQTSNRSAWLVHNGSGGGQLYLFNNSNSNTIYLNGAGASFINTSANLSIGSSVDSGHRLLISGSGVSGSLNVDNTLFVSGSVVKIKSASVDYQQNLSLQTGSWQTIVASPTGSYKAAFFDYVMFSGSIGRAGTVTTFWSASATEFYENFTEDLGGSTTGVVLQTAISASQIALQATASSAAWTIRSLVRLL